MSNFSLSDALRHRGLLIWAHLYFALTFVTWYRVPKSFSAEGWEQLSCLPVWYLEWLPRLPESMVPWFLELLGGLAVLGAIKAYRDGPISKRILAVLFVAKLYLYLLDLRLFTTYHHMHLFMVALMLFGVNLGSLRLGLWQIYFFSALGKFNDSWMEGRYFIELGCPLPLLGDNPKLLLWISWAVIVLELFGPVAWYLPWRALRKFSLLSLLAFHLYSGLIVGFPYPLLMLPLVILLLWPLDEAFTKEKPHPILIATLLIGLAPTLIGSDTRYTAEGRYFSFGNMFDANRQVEFETEFDNGGHHYLLKVTRAYPRGGFYDASTQVLLSTDNQPFEHVYQKELFDPDYFRRTHLRIIGDPYLHLYATRRLSEGDLKAALRSSLNSGEAVNVWEFDGPKTDLPSYRPWGGNDWLKDE